MVLTDDNFATIVKAIELGRWIYDNIKKYLTFLIRCNMTEVAVIGGVVLISAGMRLWLAAILSILMWRLMGLPCPGFRISTAGSRYYAETSERSEGRCFSTEVHIYITGIACRNSFFSTTSFYHDFADMNLRGRRCSSLFIIIEMIIALNFRSMRYSVLKVPPHKWFWIAMHGVSYGCCSDPVPGSRYLWNQYTISSALGQLSALVLLFSCPWK
jgi:Ca2+-transporting ATPase